MEEEDDDFLNIVVPPVLDTLEIKHLHDILQALTNPLHGSHPGFFEESAPRTRVEPSEQSNKLIEYYNFVTFAAKQLDKIPKERVKNTMIKNLNKLLQSLNEYTDGPLREINVIIMNIKNTLKKHGLVLKQKEDTINKYQTFIQEALVKLPSLPEDRKKETIVKNIDKIKQELERIKSGQIKKFGIKSRNLKRDIEHAIKLLEANQTTKTAKQKQIESYYKFIENVKAEIPRLELKEKKKEKIKLLLRKLNKLKRVVDMYYGQPKIQLEKSQSPSALKFNIKKTLQRLKR